MATAIFTVLLAGTLYSYLGLHNFPMTGAGFLALAIYGVIAKTTVTPMILLALFCGIQNLQDNRTRLIFITMFIALFSIQFVPTARLILKAKQIGNDSRVVRSIMWESDLLVLVWRRLTTIKTQHRR